MKSTKVATNIDIQIELWPIERLIPRANNPRTHNREQVANIAASRLLIRERTMNIIAVAPDAITGIRIIPKRLFTKGKNETSRF